AVLGLKDLALYPVQAFRKPVPDFLTALIDKGSMTDGQMLMLGVVGSFLFLLFALKERRVAWWQWGILAAQMAGLLINFKRGSWFCAIILIGVMVLLHLRWKAWLLAVVVVVGFLLLPPVQTRLGELKREFNVEGGGRMTMWFQIAPALIREHPGGIGYGCLTNERMRQVFSRVERNRNHLHANGVQVLVETGWLGLGLYLAWMVKALMDGVTRVRTGIGGERAVAWVILLLLLGLLLNGVVEYNFGDTEIMFVYAVLMGLAAGTASSPKKV
ncbi:MAG: O-antigen ligase family protein, partial [bacterium]